MDRIDIDTHNEKMNNLAVQMHLSSRQDLGWLRDENSELLRILGAIIISNGGKISFSKVNFDLLRKIPEIEFYEDRDNMKTELRIKNDK